MIAEGLRPDETNVAKAMTRNPVFVMSNSSAIEALQKMVKGIDTIFASQHHHLFFALLLFMEYNLHFSYQIRPMNHVETQALSSYIG